MVIPDHHDARPWPTHTGSEQGIGPTNDTGVLHGVDDVFDPDRRQTPTLQPSLDDSLDKPASVLIGQEHDKLGRLAFHYRTPVVKTSAS